MILGSHTALTGGPPGIPGNQSPAYPKNLKLRVVPGNATGTGAGAVVDPLMGIASRAAGCGFCCG